MNLQEKTSLYNTFFRKFLILFIFLGIHAFFFNYNSVEWGDSYRILRAAEQLKFENTYPDDEKRPPLFSYILSFRPYSMDPVQFGRIIVFVFSLGSFVIFNLLLRSLDIKEKYHNLALILFVLNPVYFYWSIRIMADVPFSFFALLCLYLFSVWRNSMDLIKIILIGIITALAILMRFEGYLLFAGILAGLFFGQEKLVFRFKTILDIFKKGVSNLKYTFFFVIIVFLIITPYWMYRSPFSSSYLNEPSGRIYDLNTIWIYIVSLLFLLGLAPAFYLLVKKFSAVWDFLSKNLYILVFLVLELVLVLAWPAAVPRLFVPVIPFLIILLVISLQAYFEDSKNKILPDSALFFLFIAVLGVSQYFLRLQFLIPQMKFLAVVLVLQAATCVFILLKKYNFTVYFTFIVLTIWLYLSVNLHKNILISVQTAAEYAADNLSGVIVHNDVSSVSNWNVNEKNREGGLRAYYANFDNKETLTEKYLKENGVDYLLITNEHNPEMEIDLSKRKHLKLVKEFRYNINGTEFVSQIVEFVKTTED